MFCPNCRAEYREGFSRCSDCGIELVEVLPPPEKLDTKSLANDRPDKARPAYLLAWFVPMTVFSAMYFLIWIKLSLLKYSFLTFTFVIMILLHNFGAFWMIYQSIRYERKVWRYALMSFIAFMFIWYRLVRYPLRQDLPRLP